MEIDRLITLGVPQLPFEVVRSARLGEAVRDVLLLLLPKRRLLVLLAKRKCWFLGSRTSKYTIPTQAAECVAK